MDATVPVRGEVRPRRGERRLRRKRKHEKVARRRPRALEATSAQTSNRAVSGDVHDGTRIAVDLIGMMSLGQRELAVRRAKTFSTLEENGRPQIRPAEQKLWQAGYHLAVGARPSTSHAARCCQDHAPLQGVSQGRSLGSEVVLVPQDVPSLSSALMRSRICACPSGGKSSKSDSQAVSTTFPPSGSIWPSVPGFPKMVSSITISGAPTSRRKSSAK